MTSETIQMERFYPAGHRDRHVARLCPGCGSPLTADGRCTECAPSVERPRLDFPDRMARLERMEQAADR